jgi:hypothetical protein
LDTTRDESCELVSPKERSRAAGDEEVTKLEEVALAISGSDDPANILMIHRHRARMAVERLRNPDDKIVEAGEFHDNQRLAFNAMIDAILNEES